MPLTAEIISVALLCGHGQLKLSRHAHVALGADHICGEAITSSIGIQQPDSSANLTQYLYRWLG